MTEMANGRQVATGLKALAAANWDIGVVQSTDPLGASGRVHTIITRGNRYVLKEQNDPGKVAWEAALLGRLRRHLPTAPPMVTRDGRHCAPHGDTFYVLYPFLQGHRLDHQRNVLVEGAEFVGEAIGRLHGALRDIELAGYPTMNLVNDVGVRSRHIIAQNKKHLDCGFALAAITHFEKHVTAASPLLPQQIIHRDMHPGNMLIKDDQLSGIVDFELSVRGARLFDPCYLATSILVEVFDEEERRLQWPGFLVNLLRSYGRRIRLTKNEITSVIWILYAIQLIFMAFSCTIDDIDAATCNERILKWLYAEEEGIDRRISTLHMDTPAVET